jgi:hypothetical protein
VNGIHVKDESTEDFIEDLFDIGAYGIRIESAFVDEDSGDPPEKTSVPE